MNYLVKSNPMRLIFFFISVFFVTLSIGQVSSTTDLLCLNQDYGFEFDYSLSNSSTVNIDNTIHKNGDKIFICESRLPIIISIKDLVSDMVPIPNTINYVWDGDIDGSYGQDYQAKLVYTNFTKVGKKAEFTCEIEFSGGEKVSIQLTVLIYDSVGLHLTNTRMANAWSLDDNSFSSYPDYTNAKPWMYFPVGNQKNVLIFDKVYSNPEIKNIENIDFTHVPNEVFNLSKSKLKLELNQKTSSVLLNYSSTVVACENIEIANIDVRLSKPTQKIKVITVCETDDDQANYCIDKNGDGIPYGSNFWDENGMYVSDVDGSLMSDCITPINSIGFDCIDPGIDGSLDLYAFPKIYQNKPNDLSRPKDVLAYNPDKVYDLKVKPSFDPSFTNPYFCNSRPLKESNIIESCPNLTAAEKVDLEASFQTLFGKVDVDFEFEYETIAGNFDNKIDDNILDRIEKNFWHAEQTNGLHGDPTGSAPNDHSIIWIVNKIGPPANLPPNLPPNATIDVAGRAIASGSKTCLINPALITNRTYVHEIGHCTYELHHPDSKDWPQDGLLQQEDFDNYNFMNSGGHSGSSTISLKDFIIRRYQWENINNLNN